MTGGPQPLFFSGSKAAVNGPACFSFFLDIPSAKVNVKTTRGFLKAVNLPMCQSDIAALAVSEDREPSIWLF